jgi:hypothetical protein
METTFEFRLIHGGDDPLQGLQDVPAPNSALDKAFEDGHAELPHPVALFFEKAKRNLLTKNIGGISETSWDEPLVKLELSPAFIERSNQRLQKMRAAVEKVFAGHPEECQKAIEIGRQALIDARNEALTAA